MAQLAPQYLQGQQAQVQRAVDLTASMALDRVRSERPEIFNKYGPEVYGYLAKVPKTDWTVDNLNDVANLVAGKHYRELAREEAQRLAVAGSTDAGVIRSQTGAAPNLATPTSTDFSPSSEKIPAEYRARMAAVGIDARTMDEWCRVNNMTHEQFVKQFEHTAITEHSGRAVQEVGAPITDRNVSQIRNG